MKAAALVGDGAVVGLGGALSIVAGAHGVDVDLLWGTVELTYVGFEFDFGVAADYRRACEEGQV